MSNALKQNAMHIAEPVNKMSEVLDIFWNSKTRNQSPYAVPEGALYAGTTLSALPFMGTAWRSPPIANL